MALIFRQKIMTNALEVYALYKAVSAFVYTPLTSDRKVTPAAFLAAEPLRKLAGRLHTKYINEQANSRAHQFAFTFSPQELVAIYTCVHNPGGEPVLAVVLDKVQRKVLNFDNHIELNLNHKSLKQ